MDPRLNTGFICDSQEAEVLRSSLVGDEVHYGFNKKQPSGAEAQPEEEEGAYYLEALVDDEEVQHRDCKSEDAAKREPKERQIEDLLARLDELEDKAKCQLQHNQLIEQEMRYVQGQKRLDEKKSLTWANAGFRPDHPAKWVHFLAAEDQKGDECPICSQDFYIGYEVAQLSCGHVFCRGCFVKGWKKGHRVCPCCKQNPRRE